MPSQSFTHAATANAPIDHVWAALDRPKTWQGIGGVDRVFEPKLDGHGRLQGFSFETVAAGNRYVGVATPRRRVEGETMAWDISSSEVKGVTSVALDSVGDGTRITVSLQVESTGFLSTMFFPVIAAAVGQGLPTAVEEFAATLSGSGNLR